VWSFVALFLSCRVLCGGVLVVLCRVNSSSLAHSGSSLESIQVAGGGSRRLNPFTPRLVYSQEFEVDQKEIQHAG